jgi:hypothetical protein
MRMKEKRYKGEGSRKGHCSRKKEMMKELEFNMIEGEYSRKRGK